MFGRCRISHRLTSSAQECDFIFLPSVSRRGSGASEERGAGLLAVWAALLSRDLEGPPHPWVMCLLLDRPASSHSCQQQPVAAAGLREASCSEITYLKYYNHILISVNYRIHRFHRESRPATRFPHPEWSLSKEGAACCTDWKTFQNIHVQCIFWSAGRFYFENFFLKSK